MYLGAYRVLYNLTRRVQAKQGTTSSSRTASWVPIPNNIRYTIGISDLLLFANSYYLKKNAKVKAKKN